MVKWLEHLSCEGTAFVWAGEDKAQRGHYYASKKHLIGGYEEERDTSQRLTAKGQRIIVISCKRGNSS